MELASVVEEALERAWVRHETHQSAGEVAQALDTAIQTIVGGDSAPNRQFLLAIVGGAVADPESSPRALQNAAGVDRRSQAKPPSRVLATFCESHGLTLKISQDPGVSNQWREPQIDADWVAKRRPHDQDWARAFLTIADALDASPVEERAILAEQVLDAIASQIVEHALGNTLAYPSFPATVAVARELGMAFLSSTSDRPDALEALVTAACRAIVLDSIPGGAVERGDTNAPDPIDVLILRDGNPTSGIEVTDNPLTVDKLKHEVIKAMTHFGLRRATVVARGVASDQVSLVEAALRSALLRTQLQIDVVEIDAIWHWLSTPTGSSEVATNFVRLVGAELDEFGSAGNRRLWLGVLNTYLESSIETE